MMIDWCLDEETTKKEEEGSFLVSEHIKVWTTGSRPQGERETAMAAGLVQRVLRRRCSPGN